MRVVAGSFATISAVLEILANFHNFPRWCGSLTMACFFAFYRVRQPGEPPWIYLTNPRAIVTLLSAVAIGITGIVVLLQFAQ